MKTVKITKAWAGRELGEVVEMYDETLAAAVVDGGHGEYVEDPGPTEIEDPGPAQDRAMQRPPRGRG